MRHVRPGERKRSPGADPSDDPPTRKRNEWKARTRTEGDSKAPSASTATSTCCKAGARGKHTRNVVTTPGSVRGEEKSLEPGQENRPEERTSPSDSVSNARHRYPIAEKRNNPIGKAHFSTPSIDLGVTKTPRKRKGEKRETSSRVAAPTSH